MAAVRIAVITSGGEYELRLRIGKREFLSRNTYTRERDAKAAAQEVARDLEQPQAVQS